MMENVSEKTQGREGFYAHSIIVNNKGLAYNHLLICYNNREQDVLEIAKYKYHR